MENINHYEIEDFDCLIGNEDTSEITEEELNQLKSSIKENHNNRTTEQKLKNELYSLYFNLEDSINQKAIEYSEKIPTSYDDEKKAIAVDYTEGAKNVLKELKKIINNIDK